MGIRRPPSSMPVAVLLGTAQDGGRPQPGCTKACCAHLPPSATRHPVSLGLVDEDGNAHLIEATRALGDQLALMGHPQLRSVLLTHAHIGHVDGLTLFGKETLNARDVMLYASPSMHALIDRTPHWSLMVEGGTFTPHPLQPGLPVELHTSLTVEAVQVPHRDELSDMHAFLVRGPQTSLLFLPDHDRWSDTLAHHGMPDIRAWLADLKVDVALVDGTFWSKDELQGRFQSEVPHPPVEETLQLLGPRIEGDPEIVFIHLNHTNPLHDGTSPEAQRVKSLGWTVGEQGMRFTL